MTDELSTVFKNITIYGFGGMALVLLCQCPRYNEICINDTCCLHWKWMVYWTEFVILCTCVVTSCMFKYAIMFWLRETGQLHAVNPLHNGICSHLVRMVHVCIIHTPTNISEPFDKSSNTSSSNTSSTEA